MYILHSGHEAKLQYKQLIFFGIYIGHLIFFGIYIKKPKPKLSI